MTYSVAVKTHNKEQSVEILDFIDKNISEFKEIFPNYSTNGYRWSNSLSYIEDYPHIGFNFSTLNFLKRIYIYSILYNIAIKFNLHTNINGIAVVTLDYDSDYTFFIAEKNPFEENDERAKAFILVESGLIKIDEEYSFFDKIFMLIPNKKEIEKIQEIIKNIHN